MKYAWMTLLCALLLPGVATAEDKLVFEDQRDKDSYSVGYQMGQDFRKHKIPIDPEILRTGLLDGLEGDKPQLTAGEMRAALRDLERRMKAASSQVAKEQATKNLAEAAAFFSENKTRAGVKSLPSGLQYKVMQEGTGAMPKAGDTVTVHYRGTLIDGTEFDSAYARGQPATFRVKRVIAGWTEALQLMKEGAKWQLFVPPDFAYGDRGSGANIPPNSTLIFDIELISIN